MLYYTKILAFSIFSQKMFQDFSRKDRMYEDQLEQDIICMEVAAKRLQKYVEEKS